MKPTTPERPRRGPRETVTLIAPHRHGGVDHPEGASIKVFPHQRETLEAEGKIKPRSGASSRRSPSAGDTEQQDSSGGNDE
ncbi:DUF7210 family protein [Spectribacter hydrogenooxidans]|uniref:DUF7210 domain-containing protein n=1 Tax=Spectribacter hydrogenoxidans TaxID=3075608 RepID=A0ABU3C0L7_9GAMM|nr:hypothetical protein [Salinisphaera sp. W335]MDT0635100.1 hypothetical protein [Salinisphaera sp. W335]